MNRAGFLKRLFGAAVVAAMPKIVVEQIEALPEPVPISPVVNGGTPVFTKLEPIAPNGLLYIYDEKDGLIGMSRIFSLEFKREFINLKDEDEGWPSYFPGLRSWNISAEDIHWVRDSRKYFAEFRKLNCILLKDDKKISGDIYITQLEFTSPMFEELSCRAEFEGSGALILEPNDSNN